MFTADNPVHKPAYGKFISWLISLEISHIRSIARASKPITVAKSALEHNHIRTLRSIASNTRPYELSLVSMQGHNKSHTFCSVILKRRVFHVLVIGSNPNNFASLRFSHIMFFELSFGHSSSSISVILGNAPSPKHPDSIASAP